MKNTICDEKNNLLILIAGAGSRFIQSGVVTQNNSFRLVNFTV